MPLRQHIDVHNASKEELIRYIESVQNENKELKTTIHWQTKNTKNKSAKCDSSTDDAPKRRVRQRTLSESLEEGKVVPESDESANLFLQGDTFSTVQDLFTRVEILNKKMIWNKKQFGKSFAKARHPREPSAYSEQAQAMVCISCGGISSSKPLQDIRSRQGHPLVHNQLSNDNFQQDIFNSNSNTIPQMATAVPYMNQMHIQPDIIESTVSTTNLRYKPDHVSPLSLNQNTHCTMPPTMISNIENFTLRTYLTPRRSNPVHLPTSNATQNGDNEEDAFGNTDTQNTDIINVDKGASK